MITTWQIWGTGPLWILRMVYYTYVEIKVRKLVGESSQIIHQVSEQGSPKKHIFGGVNINLFATSWTYPQTISL